MSLPFSKYIEVKDRICIGYFGPSTDYLVQLRALRPNIEAAFPGIKVWLASHDRHVGHFGNEPRVLPLSRVKTIQREFGKIHEVLADFREHPVEKMMEESGVPLVVETEPLPPERGRCIIVAKGEPPTANLTDEQIKSAIDLANREGYTPVLGDEVGDAAWVIGVESAPLFESAISGTRTTLVPTGLGTNLFKKMFPGYEVLKIQG